MVTAFDLPILLDQLVRMLQYGMWLHLAVALGLLVWGIKLLLKNPQANRDLPLHASLLLIVPCPICATVILLNLTLAFSIFSMSPVSTTFVLFGLFCGIILLTSGAVSMLPRQAGPASSFLGLSMILVALYFLFTVMIAPVYPEIKAAFVMSGSNNPAEMTDPIPLLILAGTAFVLGGAGFAGNYFRKGNKPNLFPVFQTILYTLSTALLLSLMATYQILDFFNPESEITIMKKVENQWRIITKKGKEIEVKKVTNRKVGGDEGLKPGTAYQLKSGRVVYVPEEIVNELD